MRAAIVLVCLLGGTASADSNLANWLVGPVFGVVLGSHGGGVFGVEGGGGYGPERFNLGFEHRGNLEMGYVEIDPWYIVGGTLGVGVQSDNQVKPVVGFWEGLPLTESSDDCIGWRQVVTMSAGYRYTGVHELYISFKAGWIDGTICLD
jgi:hypothetical protein